MATDGFGTTFSRTVSFWGVVYARGAFLKKKNGSISFESLEKVSSLFGSMEVNTSCMCLLSCWFTDVSSL